MTAIDRPSPAVLPFAEQPVFNDHAQKETNQ